MRFGYWLPVFGGWLRNVDDEGMEASWDYVSRLAVRSEEFGYDLTLVAELSLNDVKGADHPCLDAWSTAAGLAAVTRSLEIMVAVRPTFHPPAPFAKQAANIDRMSGGRLSLNVVSSWWKEEARQYGIEFDQHDRRYERTAEWLDVVDGLWRETPFSYQGAFYRLDGTVCSPKPLASPRPRVYAGGESDAGKRLISRKCDAWLTHGDPPEVLAPKIADMKRRREEAGKPPMSYGVAAYAICRQTEEEARRELERITDVSQSPRAYHSYRDWVENTQLERRLSLEDYSVSNRGLRTGLVGTPEQVARRLAELEDAGVDLVLLQMSPQLEEMERFAAEVMPLVRPEPLRREASGRRRA